MTGIEAIEYIHSMEWDRKATGYEHAKELLLRMGNPEKKLKFIHIGGTNGKGSTAAMLASIMQKAGYKTGLYTSPYLYRFNERMQINGEQISDEELGVVTEYVKGIVDDMPIGPSEFALVCCIAFEYFARQNCDVVILEVGMGGENDSTNVIECPEVAILTNIGLDHTEYLGNTIEEIALTKAGILKKNGVAVVYPTIPKVEAVLQSICNQRSVKMIVADFDNLVEHQHDLEGQVFSYRKRQDIFLPLLGEHQLKNAAVVLETIDVLIRKGWNISEDAICAGMEETKWPGRFEVLGVEPIFIIDGGHNPQCMEALAKNITTYLVGRKVIALTGVLQDKDYREMYQPILPYVSEFVCITPPTPRKLEAEILAEWLKSEGAMAVACKSIQEGVQVAVGLAGDTGAVVCFGSLYSIGDIKTSFESI